MLAATVAEDRIRLARDICGLPRDVPCLDWSNWAIIVRKDIDEELAYRLTSIIVEHRGDLEGLYQPINDYPGLRTAMRTRTDQSWALSCKTIAARRSARKVTFASLSVAESTYKGLRWRRNGLARTEDASAISRFERGSHPGGSPISLRLRSSVAIRRGQVVRCALVVGGRAIPAALSATAQSRCRQSTTAATDRASAS